MDNHFHASRNTENQDENTLRPDTRAGLTALPASMKLQALVQQFPRIANRIASAWNRPAECERYLDELLFSDRSNGRQGFPPQVCLELMQVKSFLIDVLKEERHGVQSQWHDVRERD